MTRVRNVEIDREAKDIIPWTMNELTGVQREAVEWYAEDGYMPMNDYLRYGERGLQQWADEMLGDLGIEEGVDVALEDAVGFGTQDIIDMIPEAQRAIEAGRTTEDVTSFRFMTFKPGDALDRGLVPGAEFTDPGFVSTTLAPDQWSGLTEKPGELRMEIRVPKGSHAIWIGPHEAEMLLPKGTTFRVLERVGNVVQVEVV